MERTNIGGSMMMTTNDEAVAAAGGGSAASIGHGSPRRLEGSGIEVRKSEGR